MTVEEAVEMSIELTVRAIRKFVLPDADNGRFTNDTFNTLLTFFLYNNEKPKGEVEDADNS